MFEKAIPIIQNSNNVLILPHISLDGDALGSAYSLRLLLLQLGKNAYVMQGEEHRLTGILYGVSDNTPLAEYDLAIAVDCGDSKRIDNRIELFNKCENKIVIDHHDSHVDFGDIDIVDADTSATGEMIYKLAKELDINITAEIATDIYLAISSDSGGFMFANTTVETMRIAADLMELNAENVKVNTELFAKNTLVQLKLKQLALDSMTAHLDGKVACIFLTRQQMTELNADPVDTEGLINLPRSLDTVSVALFIKEAPEGGVKVSMRSDGSVNVAELCRRHGGGGHIRAAGCSLDCSIGQARETLVSELKELLT